MDCVVGYRVPAPQEEPIKQNEVIDMAERKDKGAPAHPADTRRGAAEAASEKEVGTATRENEKKEEVAPPTATTTQVAPAGTELSLDDMMDIIRRRLDSGNISHIKQVSNFGTQVMELAERTQREAVESLGGMWPSQNGNGNDHTNPEGQPEQPVTPRAIRPGSPVLKPPSGGSETKMPGGAGKGRGGNELTIAACCWWVMKSAGKEGLPAEDIVEKSLNDLGYKPQTTDKRAIAKSFYVSGINKLMGWKYAFRINGTRNYRLSDEQLRAKDFVPKTKSKEGGEEDSE